MSAFGGKADMTFAVTVGGAFLQLFTNIQETLLGREGNVGLRYCRVSY
jgi:hypothetical protein